MARRFEDRLKAETVTEAVAAFKKAPGIACIPAGPGGTRPDHGNARVRPLEIPASYFPIWRGQWRCQTTVGVFFFVGLLLIGIMTGIRRCHRHDQNGRVD